MTSSKARNPLVEVGDLAVKTIGDLHFGRSFLNGVPLENRGKIEAAAKAEYERLLKDSGEDLLVLMGDCFDKFDVDNGQVSYMVDSLIAAARRAPDRTIVVLRGNHDDSKDTTLTSSFALMALALRLADLDNLHIVTENPLLIDDEGDKLLFLSWSATYSAKEIAEKAIATHGTNYDAVFGHWDVNLPENTSWYNMIPTEQFKGLTALMVTGHDHHPDTLERDGITIVKTGSILPFAHGEQTDEDDLIYTITVEEYEKDKKKYQGKMVRFILEDDEEVPEGDFLQVKVLPKPKKSKTETAEDGDDEPDSFDLPTLLKGFLAKQGIDEATATKVTERFSSRNAQDT